MRVTPGPENLLYSGPGLWYQTDPLNKKNQEQTDPQLLDLQKPEDPTWKNTVSGTRSR